MINCKEYLTKIFEVEHEDVIYFITFKEDLLHDSWEIETEDGDIINEENDKYNTLINFCEKNTKNKSADDEAQDWLTFGENKI